MSAFQLWRLNGCRNVDEDNLIFKSNYIYDILAQKLDPGGGCILTPMGTPSNISANPISGAMAPQEFFFVTKG